MTDSTQHAAAKAASPLKRARRAVIDVGTNSVKLLVADVAGSEIFPVAEESKQTRLGRGFYETHQLQTEAIQKTAEAVARFAAAARELKTDSVRAIATSAARDAVNAHELTSAIESASGLRAEIISGEKEADWVFQGVTTDSRLANRPLLILDVGGGSTEFILGHGKHQHFRKSFSLGTVRLLEKFPHSDPPGKDQMLQCQTFVREFLNQHVRSQLEPAMQKEFNSARDGVLTLVGTGGTTSILARMEAGLDDFIREKIEATRLSLERVRWHREHLWKLPLSERQNIVGLPKKRADVILTGVVIYEAVMERFDFSELRVSTRGLRFAALMDTAQLK